EIVSHIAIGGAAEIMSPVAHEEEARKQITATLMLGRPIILLDNVGGKLSSHALSRALTSTTWSDRILGHSKMATLPQRAIWIATGNNLKIGGDLPRRCYRIFMDAKMARPWERDPQSFTHPNILSWVGDNRGELLSALLTIARNWFAAGRPKWSGRPLGTFEGWSVTLGGMLESAGIVGFLDNQPEVYDRVADDGSEEWEEFLTAWHETYGEEAITVKKLLEDLDGNQVLKYALPVTLALAYAESGNMVGRKFGEEFANKDGVRFGAESIHLKQCGKDKKHKVSLWRVTKGAGPDGGRRGRRGQQGQSPPPPSGEVLLDTPGLQDGGDGRGPASSPNVTRGSVVNNDTES
ncbi:MAG TPA: hypothetical protein VE225_08405, partial [Rubrobacteraceae bacterium]|nr:hypothetical protein [Rubrobacteraceae bacterium]